MQLITKCISKTGDDCTKSGKDWIPERQHMFPKDILIGKLRGWEEISVTSETLNEFEKTQSLGKGNMMRNIDFTVLWAAAPCGLKLSTFRGILYPHYQVSRVALGATRCLEMFISSTRLYAALSQKTLILISTALRTSIIKQLWMSR
jgi:hypothetical protein